MVDVPWPISSSPGNHPQEGAGRLINVFGERRGDLQAIVWRRAPGAVVFARAGSVGTAAGSASALGISSVIEAQGIASGSATASAVSDSLMIRSGIGQADGNSDATAGTEVIIAAPGSADGDSSADAVGGTA